MKNAYIPALDGIRFLAVTLVLVDHWSGDSLGFPASYLGVCMFFVLSGFLITRILLKAKHKDESLNRSHGFSLKQFYIRRTIRIFPVYYLTLALLFIFNVPPVRDRIWWLVTYNTNNYIAYFERWMGSVDHLWSLAVEEQFYLFFPFLILFLGWKSLPRMLIFITILSVGLRLFFYLRGDEWMRSYVLVFTCLDAFGIGGLLAYFSWNENGKMLKFFGSWQPLLFSVVAYAFIVLWGKTYDDGHNFVSVVLLRLFESLLSVALIGKVAVSEEYRSKNSAWLTTFLSGATVSYLGKISYGIYIYHNFVYNFYHSPPSSPVVMILNALEKFADSNWQFQVLKIGILYAIVVVIATFSWFFIEKPINRFKNRFGY